MPGSKVKSSHRRRPSFTVLRIPTSARRLRQISRRDVRDFFLALPKTRQYLLFVIAGIFYWLYAAPAYDLAGLLDEWERSRETLRVLGRIFIVILALALIGPCKGESFLIAEKKRFLVLMRTNFRDYLDVVRRVEHSFYSTVDIASDTLHHRRSPDRSRMIRVYEFSIVCAITLVLRFGSEDIYSLIGTKGFLTAVWLAEVVWRRHEPGSWVTHFLCAVALDLHLAKVSCLLLYVRETYVVYIIWTSCCSVKRTFRGPHHFLLLSPVQVFQVNEQRLMMRSLKTVFRTFGHVDYLPATCLGLALGSLALWSANHMVKLRQRRLHPNKLIRTPVVFEVTWLWILQSLIDTGMSYALRPSSIAAVFICTISLWDMHCEGNGRSTAREPPRRLRSHILMSHLLRYRTVYSFWSTSFHSPHFNVLHCGKCKHRRPLVWDSPQRHNSEQ